MKNNLIVGCVEEVSFPKLGIQDVWSKIDTGAFSGALHCKDIRIVRRGMKREKVLKFTPLGDKTLATETKDFLETQIRSATGHQVKRYLIDTDIIIRGNKLPVRIGISDRSKMTRPVLIGRRFLRDNNILVDVQINQHLDTEGELTQ